MIDTMHTKQVSEYDHIPDSELVKELTSLYLKDKKWSKFLTVRNTTAYFKHYVGTVQTEHYTISVLPKIWSKDETVQKVAMKNLLRLILYTYLTPSMFNPEVLVSPTYEKNDLFELLIMLYSITLENELNQGVYRRYVGISEESRYLRGKLNLERQLNRLDKSVFDITDFRFSADNEMNRYFSFATNLFSTLARDVRNQDLLNHIELIFKSEDIGNLNLPTNITFNRLNERFQIPYNYANQIIKHMIPESGNNKQAMMMLFDMNVVFQEFFVKFVKKNESVIFLDSKVKIKPQVRRRNFIFDESNPLRLTIPDLYIEVKKENVKKSFIFDTKYKLMDDIKIDEGRKDLDNVFKITQSDLYQMFTYSKLYLTDGIILVFPGNKQQLPGNKQQLAGPYNFDKDGPILWIFMLPLDFTDDDWEKKLAEEFRKEFKKISNF